MGDNNGNKKKDERLEKESGEGLVKRWTVGSNWCKNHMQVTGTNKNAMGEIYNHQDFIIGLTKLQKIEDELERRGIEYG